MDIYEAHEIVSEQIETEVNHTFSEGNIAVAITLKNGVTAIGISDSVEPTSMEFAKDNARQKAIAKLSNAFLVSQHFDRHDDMRSRVASIVGEHDV